MGKGVVKKSGKHSVVQPEPLYATSSGRMYVDKIESALETTSFRRLSGKVDLIFTSPPFPLVRKKRYGNETGEAYRCRLVGLGYGHFAGLQSLSDYGSFGLLAVKKIRI